MACQGMPGSGKVICRYGLRLAVDYASSESPNVVASARRVAFDTGANMLEPYAAQLIYSGFSSSFFLAVVYPTPLLLTPPDYSGSGKRSTTTSDGPANGAAETDDGAGTEAEGDPTSLPTAPGDDVETLSDSLSHLAIAAVNRVLRLRGGGGFNWHHTSKHHAGCDGGEEGGALDPGVAWFVAELKRTNGCMDEDKLDAFATHFPKDMVSRTLKRALDYQKTPSTDVQTFLKAAPRLSEEMKATESLEAVVDRPCQNPAPHRRDSL